MRKRKHVERKGFLAEEEHVSRSCDKTRAHPWERMREKSGDRVGIRARGWGHITWGPHRPP